MDVVEEGEQGRLELIYMRLTTYHDHDESKRIASHPALILPNAGIKVEMKRISSAQLLTPIGISQQVID